MTRPASTYGVSVAGGLRVATGPLALVAANVATLLARGYRVWVRDPDDRVVALHLDHDQLHLTYHPGPGTPPELPPWVDRLSALLAELSNTTTNQERSSTP
jgi:arginase family enzyme